MNDNEAPDDGDPNGHGEADYVTCTACHKELRFADCILITDRLVVVECPCSPEPRRLRLGESGLFGDIRARLLRGWEAVAMPYTSADKPPLPCRQVDLKVNRFTLVMTTVDTVEAFLARCSRASHPTAEDSSSG